MVKSEMGKAGTLSIHILYFAILRDARGVAEETISTQSRTTLDLYRELARQHGFTMDHCGMKVAINDEFASWSDPLREGDDVIFIPPVSGG